MYYRFIGDITYLGNPTSMEVASEIELMHIRQPTKYMKVRRIRDPVISHQDFRHLINPLSFIR